MRGGALSRSLGPGAPAQRRVSRVLPRAAGASPGDRRGAWKETETRSTAAAHKPRSGHRPLPTASRRRGEVALGVTLRRGPRARSGMDVKMQIKGVRGRGRTESVPAANRPTAPRARAALRTSAAPCWAGFSRRPSAPRASRCSHLPIAFCRADAALRCRCPGNALGCSAPASPRCSGRNAEPRRTELPLRAPRRSLSRSI